MDKDQIARQIEDALVNVQDREDRQAYVEWLRAEGLLTWENLLTVRRYQRRYGHPPFTVEEFNANR